MSYKRISPQPIIEGGTNASSMANTYGVNYFDGTSIVTTAVGTATHVLTSNGPGVAPTFQAKVGTVNGDSGSATGNTITIAGTTNEVTTSASGSTVTISLPNIFMDADDVYMGLSAGNVANPGFNVFIGPSVGTSCSAGQGNVAMGYLAYDAGNNNNNTVIGNGAGGALTSGAQNCVLGQSSLARCTTGTYNTIIGAGNTSGNRYPGYDYTGSESHNILICNVGIAAENNTIRIGTQGTGNAQQNRFFAAGIYNTAVGATAGVVLVDSTSDAGQLGGLNGAANTFLVGGTKPSFTGSPTASGTITGNALSSTTTVTAGTNLVSTAGNITLAQTSSSSVGNITMAGDRYIHSYNDSQNFFAGRQSGNTTHSQTVVTAVGYQAGSGLTSGGGQNTFFGCTSGKNITSGAYNNVFGPATTAWGTGSYNLALGGYLGANYTAGGGSSANASNIYIQSYGANESNALRIGNATGTGNAQINAAYIAGITGISVTAAGSMVVVDSSNKLGTDYSTINIATAATAKTITLGTTTTTTSLAVNFGTGDATFASATGTIMLMADTGEITYPLQPSFLAYLGSSVTNATGAGTSWQLGTTTALTEVFDRNADFNTNGTFTAPVTGLYQLNVTIRVGDLGGAMTQGYVQITTTARSYQGGFCNPYACSAGNAYSFSYSVLADMAATNTATFNVVISNGAGDTADIVGSASPYATFVSGYLVA